jgi:hypothetical protein
MFELNAPLITALHDRLTADLADAIAAVNATVTDGITIDTPDPGTQILDFVPAIENLACGFPAVGIQDLPGRFSNDIGSSVDGTYELAVIVFVADPELRRLGWKLRRTLQAVAQVAMDGRRLGDATGTMPRGTIPGPTFERIPDPTGAEESGPKTYASWMAFVFAAVREDET